MFKKLCCILLVFALLFGLSVIAYADDEPADIRIPGTAIGFDTASAGWKDFSYVGFHIWEINGSPFSDWGGKVERGAALESDPTIWIFDFTAKGKDLDPESQYGVIFYNDKGAQTYNLLFTTDCLGDVAYCNTAELLENPEDSGKTTLPAYWTNQDPAVNGPQMVISSIGNVVGTCLPLGTEPGDLLSGFLTKTLDNARAFSEKTDQEIIDEIGAALGMTAAEVAAVIEETGVETDWSKEASALPDDYPIAGGYTEYPVMPVVRAGSGTVARDKEKVRIKNGVAPEYAFDTVTLTANPAEGERFVGWDLFGACTLTGEGSLDDAQITLRVTSEFTAEAYFADIEPVPGAPEYHRVTADVIEGEGEAFSEKGIIAIPGGVAPEYAYDVLVLTAVPAEGYRFVEWEIDGDWGNHGEDPDQNASQMTIRAYGDLAAHAKFERIPTGIRGDADRDGDVTIMDATRIQRVIADLDTWDHIDSETADADRDNDVTIMDATRIQRVIAELCDWDGNLLDQDESELRV